VTANAYKKTLLTAFCVFVVFRGLVCAQSPSEAEALAAIKQATNPTTKLTAAEDFIAKFPASKARPEIAQLVANEIMKVKNGTVALTLLQRAQTIFTGEQEREALKPAAFEAYVIANRADDAFALAKEILAKNPDDLYVLARMTQVGIEAARKRDRKYAEVSLQYGLKAIELIEAGKKPSNIDNEAWLDHKNSLGQLYQQTAILYLAGNNTQEARARLNKAAALSPQDANNFALLGRVINADYLSQMKAYEVMPEGKPKQDLLKTLETVLDSMIDAYARAAALALGRPEYQTLLQQVIPDLTAYYKYRHNQSTKGLQELINRYRPRSFTN